MATSLSTYYTREEYESGIDDGKGGLYSPNGKRFLRYKGTDADYTLKDGVEVICNRAFEPSVPIDSVIKNVTMPSTVTVIGDRAFYECITLESVALSPNIERIGESAFFFCKKLKELALPETLCEMGESAFCGCENLKEVRLPEAMTVVPYCAFQDCSSLERCELGKQVEKIGESAFERDKAMKSLQLPGSLKSLGNDALAWCSELQEVELPEGLESIGSSCFLGCDKLASITVPASVKDLKDNPFGGFAGELKCNSAAFNYSDGMLTTADGTTLVAYLGSNPVFVTPESIKRIVSGAFASLKTLREVVLTANVEKTESYIISMCPLIEKVTIENADLECCNEVVPYFGGLPNFKALVIPPKTKGKFGKIMPGLKEYMIFAKPEPKAKAAAEPAVADEGCYTKDGKKLKKYEGQATTYTVAAKCKTIGKRAFYNYRLLEEIVIPDSVTDIEEEAFAGCYYLKKVTFGKGVKTIGKRAFSDCQALKEVMLPAQLTVIPPLAFDGCTAMEKVVFPEGLKEIKNQAFQGCSSLQEVVLPGGLENIAYFAFKDCSKLQSIVFPDYLEEVNGFSVCKALTKVVLPKCKRIGFEAFSCCTNLQEIVIPEGVEKICLDAFYRCFALRHITLPASLVELENPFSCPIEVEMLSPNFKVDDDVIYSADGTVLIALLEDEASFTVPESVTTIGAHSLRNVFHLETVYLHEGIEKVESRDEFACVKTIYIPPKTKEKFIPMLDRYGNYNIKKRLKVKR